MVAKASLFLVSWSSPCDVLTATAAGTEEEAMAFSLQNWEQIATQHSCNRTPFDCMVRWRNHLRPCLQRVAAEGEGASWPADEDARLFQLAEDHQHRNVSDTLSALHVLSATTVRFTYFLLSLHS